MHWSLCRGWAQCGPSSLLIGATISRQASFQTVGILPVIRNKFLGSMPLFQPTQETWGRVLGQQGALCAGLYLPARARCKQHCRAVLTRETASERCARNVPLSDDFTIFKGLAELPVRHQQLGDNGVAGSRSTGHPGARYLVYGAQRLRQCPEEKPGHQHCTTGGSAHYSSAHQPDLLHHRQSEPAAGRVLSYC